MLYVQKDLSHFQSYSRCNASTSMITSQELRKVQCQFKKKNIFRAREGTLLPQRNASFLEKGSQVLGAVLPGEHSFHSWSQVHWPMVIGHLQAELPTPSCRSGEVLLRQKHFFRARGRRSAISRRSTLEINSLSYCSLYQSHSLEQDKIRHCIGSVEQLHKRISTGYRAFELQGGRRARHWDWKVKTFCTASITIKQLLEKHLSQ